MVSVGVLTGVSTTNIFVRTTTEDPLAVVKLIGKMDPMETAAVITILTWILETLWAVIHPLPLLTWPELHFRTHVYL